jgi:hypothetical protein
MKDYDEVCFPHDEHKILARNPKEKKLFANIRCGFENNLNQIVSEKVDWIYLAQDVDQLQALLSKIKIIRVA